LLLLRPDRVLGDDRLCSSAESTAPAVGVRALLLDDLDGVIIDTVLVSAFGSTTCATVELAVVVGTEPPVADADVLTVAVDETAVLGVDAAVAVVDAAAVAFNMPLASNAAFFCAILACNCCSSSSFR
jgi:hypothetical protein